MENMDKELTVPKWVLIVRPKIPQMPKKFQPKCLPKPKSSRFLKKSSLWVSVVRALLYYEKPTFSTWIGFQHHLFTHVEHHGRILPGGGPSGQKGHSVDGDIIVKCWHHIYKVILSISFKHLKKVNK